MMSLKLKCAAAGALLGPHVLPCMQAVLPLSPDRARLLLCLPSPAQVTTIEPYGAFVDLGGGLSGLLHISQISAWRVESAGKESIVANREHNPQAPEGPIFSVGDTIRAVVLSTPPKRPGVALSTRKLEPGALRLRRVCLPPPERRSALECGPVRACMPASLFALSFHHPAILH